MRQVYERPVASQLLQLLTGRPERGMEPAKDCHLKKQAQPRALQSYGRDATPHRNRRLSTIWM